jgi:hypothetical protein
MNVFAVTYEFGSEFRTILVEQDTNLFSDVRDALHPAIASKCPTIEFVGTLA